MIPCSSRASGLASKAGFETAIETNCYWSVSEDNAEVFLRPLRDAGLNMVHECQSPVFLMVEVKDGAVRLHADVPDEAPTARSFTTLMVKAFDGVAPQVVLDAPGDILHRLRLTHLLGMQRTRGLRAIYQRIKNEVARQVG